MSMSNKNVHVLCKKCSGRGWLNETYDSYMCSNCVLWLEDLCGDPACRLCSERPDTPEVPERFQKPNIVE